MSAHLSCALQKVLYWETGVIDGELRKGNSRASWGVKVSTVASVK
jgi:hypothetical protein